MSASPSNVEIQNCLQLNVSKCIISETEDRFVVTVYNPLSHSVSQFVRLPVQPGNYTVQDNNGKLRSQREEHVYLNGRYSECDVVKIRFGILESLYVVP